MTIKETETFDRLFTTRFTEVHTERPSDERLSSCVAEFIEKATSFLDCRRILRFIEQTKIEPSEEQCHELARKMVGAVIEDMHKGLDAAHPNVLIYADEAITFGELHGLEDKFIRDAHMLLIELRTVTEHRQAARLEQASALAS